MIVEAVARLAHDLGGVDVVERGLEQPAPHAAVDLGELRSRDDERPQRAGRGRDHDGVVADLLDARLEPQPAERLTDALGAAAKVARRREPAPARERACELDSELAQPPFSAALGKRVDEEPDELRVVALRELDPGRLGSRRVDLRGPASAQGRYDRCAARSR